MSDIHRTSPTIHAVSVDSQLGIQLKHLLELFHVSFYVLIKIKETQKIFRSDIGYVQGMAYLALVLLLHMDIYHAFKSFCNLVLGNEFLFCLYKFNDKKVAFFFVNVKLIYSREKSTSRFLNH